MQQQSRIAARALLIAAMLCALLYPAVGAVVLSTPEASGGAEAIYVAGNPDWFPVEYYDRDTKTYEGILPEVLKQISERTGLNFIYIQSGQDDQRQRLAENSQVEMVSGCMTQEKWLQDSGMHTSGTILSIAAEDGQINACLAFTHIATPSLIRAVEDALGELTAQEISGLCVQFMMEHPAEIDWRVVIVCSGIVLILLVFLAVQAVKLCRYKKAVKQDTNLDLLTGAWNKSYFTEFFEKFISDQYRNLYCVVYIEFDIARVNQYYGETAAEDQLCFAANELQLSVRDNEVAARVSGGGFAVARPSSGEQEIQAWTGHLLEQLNRYTERYGKDYRPDFRAGIYMLHSSDRDCETALFNARQGYLQAANGDMLFAFAHTEYLARENERLKLKKQTLDALQNREFQMFLQFIVHGKDGRIYGGEAVSRWDHPRKGLLYPSSYIELMESEGTIVELDFYIFDETCRHLEHWQTEGRYLSISCNFSRITIGQKFFVQRIKEIMARYVFDHSRLILEITEDAMESNKAVAFQNISMCKELGFRIALDDAGSGYTSFSDLRDYPIDIVKIDQSILNAAVTQRGAALLRGVSALIHNLEMEVLCEGAETQAQSDLLREIGCDYIQGYYFYRPLPLKEADRVLMNVDAHNA